MVAAVKTFLSDKNLIILFTLFAFLLIAPSVNLPADNSGHNSNSKVYNDLKQIPGSAQKVKVGFYIQNIYELDPASNTFYMDFYLWFKWKGELDPIDKLEFMNGVEDWGMTKANAYETPKVLPDSSYYQLIRIEGRFRENFFFEDYPLDEQRLGVVIENSLYTIDELVYIADTSESGYASDLAVPGWEFRNYKLSNLSHTYATNFGDQTVGHNNSDYSALQFALVVSRPVNYFLLKLLLPLIIVLFASWGSQILDPIRVDSRILMPITALLTAVFLQQAYSDALPAVSYLVLLDKIYVLTYLIIIASIMETIFTAGIVKEGFPETIKRVKRIDKWFLIINVILFSAGVLALVIIS